MLKKENLFKTNLKELRKNNELVNLSTLFIRLGILILFIVILCVGLGLLVDIKLSLNSLGTVIGAVLGIVISVIIAMISVGKYFEKY